MDRNYENWIKEIKKHIIRHDVDFDIDIVDKMMEIEQRNGVVSIVYLDVNSPTYSIKDIQNLIAKYPEFKYGLHINVAYHYPKDECWGKFLENLELLKKYTEVHSCVGHLYSENIIKKPEYNNVTIEHELSNHPELPQSFYSLYPKSQRILSDSGGIIFTDPIEIIKNNTGWCLFHPVHYQFNGTLNYSKRFGGTGIRSIEDMNNAQTHVTGNLTEYLKNPFLNIPYLICANSMLNKILKTKYRDKVTILDAGCGIGLLGIPLMLFNNMKYIGVDIESSFINAGNKMFKYLGYSPQLICADIFKTHPKADIFVFLAYEDCPIDYDKLLKLIKENYKTVIMTIVSKEKYESAKDRNKKYWYISEKEFEDKMLKQYKLIKKIEFRKPRVGGRILYWLESCQ